MDSTASIRPGDYVPTADRRFILRDAGWAGYQQILRIKGERSWRIAYLDGAVEMVGLARGHAQLGRTLGCIVTFYAADSGIEVHGCGGWLLDDESAEAGVEPDESFVFGPDPGHTRARPDLAIEVAWTRGGLNKLEIYRRLGVGEVWFWRDDVITVHVLGPSGYERRPASHALPGLDIGVVARLCEGDYSTTGALRGLRAWMTGDR